MLEERLNCVFILSGENSFTKSLSYEEAVKRFATKKKEQKCIIEVRQSEN
jgi:hypothetical protein